MRNSIRVLFPALATSVLLAACGSSSSSNSRSAATPSQPVASQSAASASSSLVKTAPNPKLGETVLVDAQGLTLYRLSGEQGGKFICTTSACVQAWHPLVVQSGGKPSGSVGSLGTVKRPGGTEQVTYKGMPLYTFVQDQTAGQANGQGIKDVGTWAAVTAKASSASATPAPAPAKPAPATPAPAPAMSAPSSGGSYGY